MKFSIRDLFLVTVIVALVLGWVLDRSRLAKRAAEGESYKELSDYLTVLLRDKNPAVKIEIHVNGKSINASEKRIVEDRQMPFATHEPPTSQAPTPNPPKP